MRLLTIVTMLSLAAGCGRKTPEEYYRLLPNTRDFPLGGSVKSQQQKGANTFVRVIDRPPNTITSELQVFANKDSAAAWFKRLNTDEDEFADSVAASQTAKGVTVVKVETDTITLTGVTSPHHNIMIAVVHTPVQFNFVARASVGTNKCAVVVEVSGAHLVGLVREYVNTAAVRSAQRIQDGC